MRFTAFFRNIFRKRSVEQDLNSELESFVDLLTEEKSRSGLAAEKARRAALIEIEGIENVKEATRDVRAGAMFDSMWRDFRYGLRVLLKKPGFFVTASLTLALGIGAATTLFSVVESQLWRPLPFPESERLVVLSERNLKQKWEQAPVSLPTFVDWRSRTRSFERIAAMQWATRRNFAAQEVTARPRVAAISSGFFETLGVEPQAGHTFRSANEQRGAQAEVILSAALARRAFGTAPTALGKPIKLDGERYSVIGVLPDTFRLDVLQTPEVFVPLEISYSASRDARELAVIGRMRAGVTMKRALSEMEAIARGIAAEHPDTNANFSVMMSNLREAFAERSARTLMLLFFTFSVFVLVIACANVAGLQLARSVVRQNEFAIRRALGASRAALRRQAIAESGWIALGGAALGILLAVWSIHLLRMFSFEDMLLRETAVSLDGWSVVFAIVVSSIATLLFGLAPGNAPEADLESALRDSGRRSSAGSRTGRHIAVLSATEVTLAFVLLFGAALFVMSNRELQHVSLGFNPRNVLTMEIPLSGTKYSDPNEIRTFYRRLMAQASTVAGVQEFALSNGPPLVSIGSVNFARADRPRPTHAEEPFSLARIVTPDYFHLLGIPVLQGRTFTEHDLEMAPRVAIVNQNFARDFFSGEDPTGKRLVILGGYETAVPKGEIQIVGVVANTREVGLNEVPFDDLYLPFAQNPAAGMYVVAKTSAPWSVAPVLRQKLQRLDSEQFVADPQMLDLYVANNLQGARFKLALVGIFAGLALALAAVALYGMLSFAVAQRTREIGIRIALGAQPKGVLGLTLGRVLRLTITGCISGLVISLMIGAVLGKALYLVPHEHSGILYNVSLRNPLSFVCTACLVVLFATVAGLIPAFRATRIDPCEALRSE